MLKMYWWIDVKDYKLIDFQYVLMNWCDVKYVLMNMLKMY